MVKTLKRTNELFERGIWAFILFGAISFILMMVEHPYLIFDLMFS